MTENRISDKELAEINALAFPWAKVTTCQVDASLRELQQQRKVNKALMEALERWRKSRHHGGRCRVGKTVAGNPYDDRCDLCNKTDAALAEARKIGSDA